MTTEKHWPPKFQSESLPKKQLVPRDDLGGRDFGSATPIAELASVQRPD
jgi:hypothetical protein